ncbi:MAG TPA: PAS domain S-box protein, partial [Phycisphaerae bacterium]|nr:PAS domain S-box protein [Phycisphaerae bacterium]
MGDHADDQQLRALRQRIETLERELQSLRAGGGNGGRSFFDLFPPEMTACRRAGSDLCREESTARALLNATTDRAILMDLEGILLAMNVPAARAFGSTPEELLGRNAFDLMPPELARARRRRADEVLRSGQPARFEDQRDGRILDNYVYPVLDGAGIPVALAIYVRDVSDQRRAERMLHEANERLQYIIDNTYDVIFTMDLEGNYTFANPAAEVMTGYTRDELLRMNMRELAAPEYHQMLVDRTTARIRGENNLPQPFYFEILRKDGRRVPVELTSTAVHRGGHVVAIQGIARDITERRRAE